MNRLVPELHLNVGARLRQRERVEPQEEPVGVPVVNDLSVLQVRLSRMADMLVFAYAEPTFHSDDLINQDSVAIVLITTGVQDVTVDDSIGSGCSILLLDIVQAAIITVVRFGVAVARALVVRWLQTNTYPRGGDGPFAARGSGVVISTHSPAGISQAEPQLNRVPPGGDVIEDVHHVQLGVRGLDYQHVSAELNVAFRAEDVGSGPVGKVIHFQERDSDN